MDFTIQAYEQLLSALAQAGYTFLTFEDFVQYESRGKVVVLRHDVDRLPGNANRLAGIEYERGIRASYFFRVVPQVWDEAIIRNIVAMEHEVAYHYEDLTIARGDFKKAIEHFARQLERLRQFYPVKTICMHGSPLSKWDNKKLWEHYDYRDFGIIAEPYFDLDYSKVFYLTDTGRAWNNSSANVRDKVASGFDIPVESTWHLTRLLDEGRLPEHLVINTHPQRWFEPGAAWLKELVFQNIKNVVKTTINSFGTAG